MPGVWLVLAVVAAGLVSPAGAAAAVPGTLSAFAGGPGLGPATNLAQSPVGVAAVGELVFEIDGPTRAEEMPPLGTPYATTIRAIDVRSGLEMPVAGGDLAARTPDGTLAVGSPLFGAGTVIGDPFGNLYVSESGANRIRVITPSGVITTIAGTGIAGFTGDGGPAKSAQLHDPIGMAFAPDGSFLFADRGNNRIRRISSGGIISTIAGTGAYGSAGDGGPLAEAQLSGPAAIGFDAQGNLYIGELYGERIRKVSPAGTISTFAQMVHPLSMAVTPAGTVLVPSGYGIKSINGAGETAMVVGSAQESGFSGDGGPATAARLSNPRGVAVDARGNIYVADSGNRRVRMIDSQGVITTIAGNGHLAYGGDGGPAPYAQLQRVSGIRNNPSGTYIIDWNNENFRHVDQAGVIRTVDAPWAHIMTTDRAGNLYLGQPGQVLKRAPDGTITVLARSGDPGVGLELDPRALAVDGSGNLYIADFDSEFMLTTIRRVDANGVITPWAGVRPLRDTSAWYPEAARHSPIRSVNDMAVGADGVLYVGTSHGLLRFSCGVVTTPPIQGFLNLEVGSYGPRGMAVDRAGNLYFAAASRVYRLRPDGQWSVVAGGGRGRIEEGRDATTVDLRPWVGAVSIDDAGDLLFSTTSRVFKVAGVSAGAAVPGPACAEPVAGGSGSPASYQPVAPARILDTRYGTGGISGAVGPGSTISLDVTGVGGVPETGVSAVAVNVTVTEPTRGGYLTVFPSGGSRPTTSTVNFLPGQTVANMAVAKVGSDGKVSIFNATGTAHVIVDIVGWYGDQGSRFNSLVPARILDTRNGTGGFGAAVGPASTIGVPVTGVGGVPATGVSAVVLNLTVTQPTGGGYLTVFPSGTARPTASSINFLPGETVANMAVAKVGTDGKVGIYNAVGSAHVVADVVGWYGDQGSQFHSMVPARILDTRNWTGGFPVGPLPAGATVNAIASTIGGLPATGISAVVLNVTVTEPAQGGYLTLFPFPMPRPATSSINFSTGQTVANLVVSKVYADGKVTIYNGAGATHVVIDVVGWYGTG